jgi:hypothetical protein
VDEGKAPNTKRHLYWCLCAVGVNRKDEEHETTPVGVVSFSVCGGRREVR